MQYILTEDEYTKLKSLAEKGKKAPSDKDLQMLCTQVADHMPIEWGWGDNPDIPKPWRCILSVKTEWYCDQCPVKRICPHPHKEWSK